MYRFTASVALVVITVLYGFGLAIALPSTSVSIFGNPECSRCGLSSSTGDSSILSFDLSTPVQQPVSNPGPPPSEILVTVGSHSEHAHAAAAFGLLGVSASSSTIVGMLPPTEFPLIQASGDISSNAMVTDTITLGSSQFRFGTIDHTGFTLSLHGFLSASGDVGTQASAKYSLDVDGTQVGIPQEFTATPGNPAFIPTSIFMPYDLAVGDSHEFHLSFGANAKTVAIPGHNSFANADLSHTLTLTINPGPGFFITSASGATYAPPTAVPEPSTMVLLSTGLVGLVAWRLKRRA